LWPAFLAFLWPMMLANIMQALSGTLNNIFIGQMLGVESLAAASVFFPVIFLLMSFIVGLGSGTSVLIGQAWGARRHEQIKAVAGTAILVTLLAGLAVAVAGVIYAREVVTALGTPANVLPQATEYARIMMLSMPGMFVFFAFTSMLRGVGDTVTPLWSLAVSTAIGLLVTPALIAGWGGLPQLGVASAAWANLVATIVALIFLGVYLVQRGHALAPDRVFFSHVRINGPILVQVLKLGVPTAVQMIIMSLAGIVLLGLVNGFGSNALAAYGAVNQVVSYVQFPAFSISITASILAAQAIGAGRSHQVGGITRVGLLMNLGLTGGLVVVSYIFSRSLLGLFLKDPAVVDLAQELLHIVLWSLVLFGASGVLAGIMRASGTVMAPMVISISVITLIEVPAAWYLSRQIGVDGVWVAYAVTFTTMFLLNAAYYRFIWRHKPIRRLMDK
jgi:putative MATE family efflux protein